MKAGDFTGLAKNYSRYRVGYSDDILKAIAALLPAPPSRASVADVGAGTGIWTRQLAAHFDKRITAVEPNDDMRSAGEAKNRANIVWKKGSAEKTGLPTASFDWVTMASSFHWPDFDKAMREFRRILRPNGIFTCLWNPRITDNSPLIRKVEEEVRRIAPPSKRKSSGKSAFVEELTKRLTDAPGFANTLYMETRFTVRMDRERYIGLWQSVNDVRSIAGDAAFERFLDFVREETRGIKTIDCAYLTRAWTVRRI